MFKATYYAFQIATVVIAIVTWTSAYFLNKIGMMVPPTGEVGGSSGSGAAAAGSSSVGDTGKKQK